VRVSEGRVRDPTAAMLDAQSIKSSEGGQSRGFDMGKHSTRSTADSIKVPAGQWPHDRVMEGGTRSV
jgi:hypothetical protein